MQANSRTIDELFNAQSRYVVPMFQRHYVWKEDPQWKTLWEDVAEKADLQLKGIRANAHYLGALIIEGVRPDTPKEVKRFLVIDGQQRLTTLQLLLCAFRDIATKNNWPSLDRKVTRYLENSDADVMEKPEEERYKLWPTTHNRDVFRNIVSSLSKETVEKIYPITRLARKRKPEPRSNLVEAYLYFSNVAEAWINTTASEHAKPAEDVAFALLQALQQDFCVVEISLKEGDDSQEIFYSLNSQGRPLSQSDLLRSLIFMQAEREKIGRDEIFEKYWGKFETSFWSNEINRGGRGFSRLDIALRYFLMAKSGKMVDARRVNEEYRRWIQDHRDTYPSVRDELADLARYADAYERFEITQPSALPSTDIRRVIADFDVSTALPLLLFLELDAGLDETQLRACCASVESFIARRIITNDETKEYNKLFVEVVDTLLELKGTAILPALSNKLLAGGGTTRRWPTDEELIEAIQIREIYSHNRAPLRLILERLEVALRTKKSEETSIASSLQIEHVMPQAWGNHWPLKGVQIEKDVVLYPSQAKDAALPLVQDIRLRNLLVNTLGNLTLLNQYLNPAASNGPFDLKKIEYKHSVLRLNRDFDSLTTWDERAILTRGKFLASELCKIWPRAVPVTTPSNAPTKA